MAAESGGRQGRGTFPRDLTHRDGRSALRGTKGEAVGGGAGPGPVSPRRPDNALRLTPAAGPLTPEGEDSIDGKATLRQA